MSESTDVHIMQSDRIERSLRRISMQILEDYRQDGKLVLAGLNTRGYFLAEYFRDILEKHLGINLDLIRIDANSPEVQLSNEDAAKIDQSTYLLIIDDVLFSGTTMIRALQSVLNQTNPSRIRIAVLVDRGHRKYPVQPDFFGIESPTKLREHVEVRFSESTNLPQSVNLIQR